MIEVIGKIGCGECLKTKQELKKNGVRYKYFLEHELDKKSREKAYEIAEKVDNLYLPIILKNGKSVTLEEVI